MKPARWILFSLGIIAFAVVLAVVARHLNPPDEVRVIEDYEPWSQKVLDVAEKLPVQDGGRIKPLSSYAGFTMLRIHGDRSMEIKPAEGEDVDPIGLSPLEWMLDALFRPEISQQQPSFRVENSDVLQAIGVEAGEKRDRYSYDDLETGRDRLFELAQTYRQSEADQRTATEKQIVSLAQNVQSYEHLMGVFSLARSGLEMQAVPGVSEESRRANASDVMRTAPVIRDVLSRSQQENRSVPPHVQNLLEQLLAGANASKFGLFVFPPADERTEEWLSPGERVMNVMTGQTRDVEGSIEDLERSENLARAVHGDGDFLGALKTFQSDIVERAKERGEYETVPLEANYYHFDWFLHALVWFLIGTLLTIGMWMTPRTLAGRILSWGVWVSTAVAFTLVVIAIVQRCLIMERPPVGNLYDTIIFITAAICVFGAIVELLTRRKFALGLMPIAGVALILLARLFEVGDATDHMDPLVAVLRSNYWLTTHVITITLGYAGGLVTALLGMVYVLLRGLRLDGGDKSLRRSLTRAVYGMVCLTLFLSLVGTVLGGIWANDSWGRFWGWDPKENGALMIVLANLAILHARLGGFIREWGLHLCAIFMAAIVTFSWWGVNLLGTGLHSYGFAEGGDYIYLLYGLVALFIIFGIVAWIIEKTGKAGDISAESSSESDRLPESGP